MVMQAMTSRVRNLFQFGNANVLITPPNWQENPIGLYELLEAYYHGNDLYSQAARVAFDSGKWLPEMKSLRTPAHRVAEFYVAHLWPDEFTIEGPNATALEKPIERVWKASNWEAKRRLAARRFAVHGDLFIKVVAPERDADTDRAVHFQLLNAKHVLDLDRDDRGFLTYCYIEIPRIERTGDKYRNVWHVEIWDAKAGTYRQWLTDKQTPVDQLGTPAVTKILRSDLGIDFIPIVHAMFKDVGNPRGESALTYAMEKIDEANLQVTRLHRMLYRNNDTTWALQANGVDTAGRPLAAVNVNGAAALSQSDIDASIVYLNGEAFLSLPGNASLASLVPQLNYEAALSIVNAMVDELERDLPELAFHRIRENGEISGRAARMMLTDAIDKATEARGNAMQALIRANQMAMTIGAGLGIEGWPEAGAFDAGALEHTYEAHDIIPEDEHERWETETLKATAAEAMIRSGLPVAETLRLRGYSETEIAKLLAERDEEKAQAAERAAQMFNAGDDGGPPEDDDEPPVPPRGGNNRGG